MVGYTLLEPKKEREYDMFREEARACSIKFPTAPESTRAVETPHAGQPASEISTKGLMEIEDGEILTLTPGDG